jgi:hypothetical protein
MRPAIGWVAQLVEQRTENRKRAFSFNFLQVDFNDFNAVNKGRNCCFQNLRMPSIASKKTHFTPLRYTMEGYNGEFGGATVIDRFRRANFTWAGCNRKKIVKPGAGDVPSISLKWTQWD